MRSFSSHFILNRISKNVQKGQPVRPCPSAPPPCPRAPLCHRGVTSVADTIVPPPPPHAQGRFTTQGQARRENKSRDQWPVHHQDYGRHGHESCERQRDIRRAVTASTESMTSCVRVCVSVPAGARAARPRAGAGRSTILYSVIVQGAPRHEKNLVYDQPRDA